MATNNAINQVGILPSFMYVANGDQTNVTGDGTVYNVIFPNKIYDATNSFDGTSTFTAPLTGIYNFTLSCSLTITATGPGYVYANLTTTGATYRYLQNNDAATFPYNVYTFTQTITCPMTAGDTAIPSVAVFGDASKDVIIVGVTSNGYRSPLFSGYMIAGI